VNKCSATVAVAPPAWRKLGHKLEQSANGAVQPTA